MNALLTSKDITDIDLIRELVRRGSLTSERETVPMPNGLEVWVRYSTKWLVEDEVTL